MKSFWESCGARGPLVLEVEGGGALRAARHAFDRPCLIIGSGPRSDLRLDHPEVGRRHAYLQVIAGRPFCVDLESRTGTRWGDGTSNWGWLAQDRPMRIGPYSIRARVDGADPVDGPSVASPLAVARGPQAVELGPWPPATLDLGREREGGPASVPVDRTLSLIGRSGRCKIRLATPGASRFHAALLRTPGGTWVVDLRSSGPLAVNGVLVDHARLEPGDELRAGPLLARMAGPPTPPGRALAVDLAVDRGPAPIAGDLREVLGLVADIQRQSNDQTRQAVTLIAQLFGSMHREAMDLVREELEQVRDLAVELKALRRESTAAREVPDPGPDPGPPPDRAGPRDPGEIHLIVGERLAAFERERRGRWDVLSKLLSGPGS